ncbi:unnamed protein product, partial [marine sediment metagenome]
MDWQGEYPFPPPPSLAPYTWWWPLFDTHIFDKDPYFVLSTYQADNLVDELRGFFSKIWSWTATPFSSLSTWLYTIWENVKVWIDWAINQVVGVFEWIWEKIQGT